MANLKPPMTEEEVKKAGIANVRIAYNKLASDYNRMLENDLLLCPKCNTWQKADTAFYYDKGYATNRYPVCKRCIQLEVEQRKSDREEPNETKDSVKKVLQKMDRIFDENFYDECVKGALDGVKEKNRQSPFATYITAIQSLPNWKDNRTGRPKSWSESIFIDEIDQSAEDINENSRIIKAARKRFGSDHPLSDLYFLETQYEDWVSRYECNTKAQEEIFERLSWKKLEINKATRNGLPTKDLDQTYQNLLNTANISPKQTGMDTFADAQTMGTLLQKYEETRPLPEIDEELRDVDKIGLYIDVFFRGHAAKMLGLKNMFTSIYEKVMSKYTVKPPEYTDDEDSEDIFYKVFGSVEDY